MPPLLSMMGMKLGCVGVAVVAMEGGREGKTIPPPARASATVIPALPSKRRKFEQVCKVNDGTHKQTVV